MAEEYEGPFVPFPNKVTKAMVDRANARPRNTGYDENLWVGSDLDETKRKYRAVYDAFGVDDDPHKQWSELREKFAREEDPKQRDYYLERMLAYVTPTNPPERKESRWVQSVNASRKKEGAPLWGVMTTSFGFGLLVFSIPIGFVNPLTWFLMIILGVVFSVVGIVRCMQG